MKTLAKDLAQTRQKQIFEDLSTFLSSLASPVRLKIVYLLAQGPHSVETLANKIGQTVANTSMHLNKMLREGILNCETQKQKRIYTLANSELYLLWEQLQDYTFAHLAPEATASHEAYGEELDWQGDEAETIKLIKTGKAQLVDVRPQDEAPNDEESYQKLVRHLPFEMLNHKKLDLPSRGTLLVICRGRLCVLSQEATALLRKKGYRASRLGHSWYQLSQLLKEK